jgi:hypothetical protein
MQVLLVLLSFSVFFTGTTNMLGSQRIATGFTILLIFQVPYPKPLSPALDDRAWSRRTNTALHNPRRGRPPPVVSQVGNVVVSTWLPICGELLWVDMFAWANLSFAYLSLIESMVVVLLQDKTGKTLFPEEWQIGWQPVHKLLQRESVKKCLRRLPKRLQPQERNHSPDGTYENRFGALFQCPFACSRPSHLGCRFRRSQTWSRMQQSSSASVQRSNGGRAKAWTPAAAGMGDGRSSIA